MKCSRSAQQHPIVSIVIPALNEENGIDKTLSGIPVRELKELGFGLEVLVVDGESCDYTRKIATDWGAQVMVECRKGYGRAYKTGFGNVKGDFVFALDADGSYPSCEISHLLRILQNGNFDFISANRLVLTQSGAMSPINRLGNRILSFMVSFLFSIRIFDSQSGMWGFRKEVLPRILPNSDGMSFSQEIKIRAFKNVRAKEVPTIYKRRIGRVKLRTFRDGLQNLLHLLKLRTRFALRN